ncbi:hypothetical protein [Nocardia brasiliensis]|uniref:hypothetical protein n=1 Tax=Nocardia brasiliensis TaxID=37326 RepID=UPI00366BE753
MNAEFGLERAEKAESSGQRFGRQMKAFRQRNLPDELITHQHIHDAGGPTRNVQSRIEGGQIDTISATTEAKYNRALEAFGLPAGSATAVLYHGGTLVSAVGEKPTGAGEPDDVESGVNALQKLNREHKPVVDLVTELDRLGIELKRARSHADGYQLTFPKVAIDRLLQTLQNATKAAHESDPDPPSR